MTNNWNIANPKTIASNMFNTAMAQFQIDVIDPLNDAIAQAVRNNLTYANLEKPFETQEGSVERDLLFKMLEQLEKEFNSMNEAMSAICYYSAAHSKIICSVYWYNGIFEDLG